MYQLIVLLFLVGALAAPMAVETGTPSTGQVRSGQVGHRRIQGAFGSPAAPEIGQNLQVSCLKRNLSNFYLGMFVAKCMRKRTAISSVCLSLGSMPPPPSQSPRPILDPPVKSDGARRRYFASTLGQLERGPRLYQNHQAMWDTKEISSHIRNSQGGISW